LENHKFITQAVAYVEILFKNRKPEWVKYHTLEHAKAVAKASEEIGVDCGLSGEDLEMVILAAWFHDTGYLEKIEGHEERSVELATSFLGKRDIPKSDLRSPGVSGRQKCPRTPKILLKRSSVMQTSLTLRARIFLNRLSGFDSKSSITWAASSRKSIG
jgi:hypothetical protein